MTRRKATDLDLLSEQALVIAGRQLRALRKTQRESLGAGLSIDGTRQLVALLREITNLESVRTRLAEDGARDMSDGELESELRTVDADLAAARKADSG